ncbi:MAG TPA: aminotransferase class I/II-fold pyridoxal phosphate-dependent enzyme [Candidatus Gemmiger excrementavium]|uniref:Aminotransferase class I/II-fold pyridoxal phosphate-dependent enzyme n=1 Tax=Candidatus Gemmiger excrementavium TaxID=2838608 RepID=A0A9D2F2T2_9FIRM|nr:aminotransferase class I/II-fold pyridoxal phosphate-dependent enzyme [Candidatus Gemmiger excrementavium]
MADYFAMDRAALTAEKAQLEEAYKKYQGMGLKLNMARGKPGPHQMDLAMGLLKMDDYTTDDGYDARNYGNLEGLYEARELFADVMGVKPEEVFVGGNSSLQLMYNLMAIGFMFGYPESPCPWSRVEKRKFLCPVPGYDRHFSITEDMGFEMINIPMTEDGPDMDLVEKLVAEDDTIKGIWCVPQYSNPDGYTYSDETVRRMAAMKTAAPDFKIFWDEAYIVHHLTEEIIETPVLLNESKKYGTEDRVFMFTSTSKITFPGAGVSAFACSESAMKYVCRHFATMIISYDKMNQLRHVRFLKNKEGVLAHMAKHRRRLVPCFDAVKTTFVEELTPCGNIAHWTNPKGGYFISLYVLPGCAKRVAQLCKDCGLTLTGAGAAYPYHKDPEDSHLRIAPTYPSLDEVETASALLCVCVRLAVVEKLLADQQ